MDSGEECDSADLDGETCESRGYPDGGTLRCNEGCRFDESRCGVFDPSGRYTLSPVPSYRCADIDWLGVWMVDFTVPTLTFRDDGVTLEVECANCGPGAVMEGDSARDTRDFSVRCTYEGTCDETYILMGRFTTDNRWEGEFRASYSGICYDCSAQIWAVVGTR